MAILTSSMQTFVDLTDQRKLSCYLTANLPTTQIQDPNTNKYNPDWTATNLTITPVIHIENDRITEGVTSGLSVSWQRRTGDGNTNVLIDGEEKQTNGNLVVTKNVLKDISTGLLSYVCTVTYNDPETKQTVIVSSELTFALIKNASNAKLLDISGEQAFKYDKKGNLTGSTLITLTATMQGVTFGKWQYKDSTGTFVDYPNTTENTSITTNQLIVSPGHAVFFDNVATIKAISNDPNVYDIFSIVKLYDGTDGEGLGGLSIIIGNEAQQIVTDSNGIVSGDQTIKIPFVGFSGASQVPITATVKTTLPSGLTLVSNTAASESSSGLITLKAADASNLGGKNSGEVDIDFKFTSVDNKIVTRKFTWSKSIKGASGASSIILTLVTPEGNVFDNGNINTEDGKLNIVSYAYEGIETITSGATYKWYKYTSGTWSVIAGATDSIYKVSPDEILNITSFKCEMTYKSKTYTAVVTLMDKTDPYISEMLAIGGTTFKNGLGGTAVYVIVRRGTSEIDMLKGPIKSSAPVSPTAGDFWWQVDDTKKTCKLMKYSGTAWAEVTNASEKQELTYNWYKRDKEGNEDSSFNKSGKVIYLSADEVDSIATLQCDVEN